MSQFKNLYDATIKLSASPTGAQQQTDYNNALSIYNNYLSSINPVYSTTYTGTVGKVSYSGIYRILQFTSDSPSFTLKTTKATNIYYVMVGSGGSGGCANTSTLTTCGGGGGSGGFMKTGYFTQPANTSIVYDIFRSGLAVPSSTSLQGSSGASVTISSSIFNIYAIGGQAGYGDNSQYAPSQQILGLGILGLPGVTETCGTRNGGINNNNISDLEDGYTLQIYPSYQIKLGGGGGGGSVALPNIVAPDTSSWGGGSGGYSNSAGTIFKVAQGGLPNTGGGGGGSRPWLNGTLQSNEVSGGTGTIIFFYVDSLVNSSSIVNNTNMSNAVETSSISKGNYMTSLLNNFIFNPATNLGFVNVNSTATIKSLTTTNSLSTYMKNQKIQQKLFYSYLPNGAPGRLIIDYTLDPTLSTMSTATGHNYFFNPYNYGVNSIYYTLLNINNLPTTPNRIYTFNFYAQSRYNSHSTIINPANISVNSVSIPLNGISNITFPTTNTYVTQNISIISSPTLPITYFAYTTVQCVNITDL